MKRGRKESTTLFHNTSMKSSKTLKFPNRMYRLMREMLMKNNRVNAQTYK